jgi:hypothetical protein
MPTEERVWLKYNTGILAKDTNFRPRALDGGAWSPSRPVRFTLRKDSAPCTGHYEGSEPCWLRSQSSWRHLTPGQHTNDDLFMWMNLQTWLIAESDVELRDPLIDKAEFTQGIISILPLLIFFVPRKLVPTVSSWLAFLRYRVRILNAVWLPLFAGFLSPFGKYRHSASNQARLLFVTQFIMQYSPASLKSDKQKHSTRPASGMRCFPVSMTLDRPRKGHEGPEGSRCTALLFNLLKPSGNFTYHQV